MRDSRREKGKEKERKTEREKATRLPLSTGQQRHKSGIPGTQYIARGWRRGGYKLQSQAWHGMHSHLLHYVIKLNGPGPNTTLGYSHFYSPSPLIPLTLLVSFRYYHCRHCRHRLLSTHYGALSGAILASVSQ